jgi:hypothetical protein
MKVTEMLNPDGTAIDEYGIKGELLLENTGLAMSSIISKQC